MPLKPATPRVYHRSGAPAAWFLMDQPRRTYPGDTGDVSDLMGGKPAATRNGGCIWAVGPSGACLDCNGTNGNLSIQLPSVLGSTSWMVRCRFLARDINAVNGVAWNPADDTNRNVQLYLAGGNSLALWGDGSHVFQLSCSYSLNEWHEAAWVRQGNLWRGYLDGVQVGSDVTDTRLLTLPVVSAYRLGTVGNASGQFFNGRADNLRVDADARTAEVIARDYADPYWRLRPPSRLAQRAASAVPRRRFPVIGSCVIGSRIIRSYHDTSD